MHAPVTVLNSENLQVFAAYVAALNPANYDHAGDIIITFNDVRGRNGNEHLHTHNAYRSVNPISSSLVVRMLTGSGWTTGKNPHALNITPPALVGNYRALALSKAHKDEICDKVQQTLSQKQLDEIKDVSGAVIVVCGGDTYIFKIRTILIKAGGVCTTNLIIQMKRYTQALAIAPVATLTALMAGLNF
jgi:hypothetical protein